MVRLKAVTLKGKTSTISEFQFHNGAIKRIKADFNTRTGLAFQFHNGAIKRTGKLYIHLN